MLRLSVPLTPTVFIRVAHAAYRMRELHDQLNTGALAFQEEWPYMPHLTIVKMGIESQAQEAYRVARDRWDHFKANRDILVSELISCVRKNQTAGWTWRKCGWVASWSRRDSPAVRLTVDI